MISPPTWHEISTLASRYDCIAMTGSLQRAVDLADRVRALHNSGVGWSGSDTDLQACLSFECRTWQHCGLEPDGDDRAYICALYQAVFNRV
ncbi:MAG: hypothetical protein FJX76_18110 [Armatimonadetes bacterium]|nr:hypothetical protein [Armatimonadota bacterium]